MLGNGGDFDDLHAVGDKSLEIGNISRGNRLTAAECGGGDHAIGVRAALAAREMKQARSVFRLCFGERMNAAFENRMHGVFLLFAVRAVAKFRPCYRGGAERDFAAQPAAHDFHLSRVAGDDVDQDIGI